MVRFGYSCAIALVSLDTTVAAMATANNALWNDCILALHVLIARHRSAATVILVFAPITLVCRLPSDGRPLNDQCRRIAFVPPGAISGIPNLLVSALGIANGKRPWMGD